jgi:cytochrome c oxidase subunit 4
MSTHSHDEIVKYARTYVGVFIALLALTFVTVLASRFHLAVPLAIAVALVIAMLKGSLVASFFMHLTAERQVIYAALILTGILLAALLALPLLTTLDHIGSLASR